MTFGIWEPCSKEKYFLNASLSGCLESRWSFSYQGQFISPVILLTPLWALASPTHLFEDLWSPNIYSKELSIMKLGEMWYLSLSFFFLIPFLSLCYKQKACASSTPTLLARSLTATSCQFYTLCCGLPQSKSFIWTYHVNYLLTKCFLET